MAASKKPRFRVGQKVVGRAGYAFKIGEVIYPRTEGIPFRYREIWTEHNEGDLRPVRETGGKPRKGRG